MAEVSSLHPWTNLSTDQAALQQEDANSRLPAGALRNEGMISVGAKN